MISKLAKGTLIYGIGTMLTRFISLLLLPFFTKYLTPADYGILAILALLTMVVQPVFSLGFSASMGPSYFESHSKVHKSQTVWTAFIFLSVSSSVLVAITSFFPMPISQLLLLPYEYSYLVSLSQIGCAFSILAIPFTLRIQFENQPKLFVILTIITSLFSIGLSILLVIYLQLGVRGMLMAQVASQLVTLLLFAVFALRETNILYDKQIGKQMLNLGLPMVPSFAFLFILMQSNRYILQWLEGLGQVGIYSIGFNIASVMSIAVGAFTTAWYPFFMSYMDKQQEASILFGKITTYYVMIFGFVTVLFFIYAKPVIHLVTQPEFHAAYMVVGLVASSYFFLGMFNLLLPASYYAKNLKIGTFAQGIAAICSVPINFYSIKYFGILGAAFGLALSHLLLAIIFLWINRCRKDFFKASYEAGRVSFVSIFLVFVASCSFLLPTNSTVLEFSYGLAITCVACIGMYAFTNKTEKIIILKFLW